MVGILNAFKEISARKTTGLGAVAGGISEALVTTAIGLFVAIPAVMMFNYFTGRVEAFDVEMDNSSSELIDYFLKRRGVRRPKSYGCRTTIFELLARCRAKSGAGSQTGDAENPTQSDVPEYRPGDLSYGNLQFATKAVKVNSNINVTPMVDVMLVLLIIFMVITPMLQNGVSVDMAKVNNPVSMPDADKEDALLVVGHARRHGLLRHRQAPGRPAHRQSEGSAGEPSGQAGLRESGRARQVRIRGGGRGQRTRRWCRPVGFVDRTEEEHDTPPAAATPHLRRAIAAQSSGRFKYAKLDSRRSVMGMAMGSGGGQSADINVTPLIDVLLVLIIIFMVITPLTPKGLDALVPQPPPPNPKNNTPDRTIVVQLIDRGAGQTPALKINQEDATWENLQGRLTDIFKTRAEKVMFVKGDDDVPFRRCGQRD